VLPAAESRFRCPRFYWVVLKSVEMRPGRVLGMDSQDLSSPRIRVFILPFGSWAGAIINVPCSYKMQIPACRSVGRAKVFMSRLFP